MPLSLHAAIIPGWLQVLGSMRGLADKAEAHCAEQGLAPADLLGARLAPDMLPLAYQFKSCVVHSQGAIEGVRAGRFSPDNGEVPASFAEAARRIDAAAAFLAALTPDELEGMIGKDMAFTIGDRFRMEFLAENFLLGFSQPNFTFHATTAYAILRAQGLVIGKRDYLGAMPIKG